jgi:hypothetical protein
VIATLLAGLIELFVSSLTYPDKIWLAILIVAYKLICPCFVLGSHLEVLFPFMYTLVPSYEMVTRNTSLHILVCERVEIPGQIWTASVLTYLYVLLGIQLYLKPEGLWP